MPTDSAEKIAPFEVLPEKELSEGLPIVARLVGRRFEQLYDGRFERPYDERLQKMLVKTLAHLCATLGATFGLAERGEVSLFAISNGGEARRLLSRIAGEAAGKMALLLGEVATFEVRLYELPDAQTVGGYFGWRRREVRNAALDAWCAHALAGNGADPQAVPRILEGLGADEKLELLTQANIDFAALPAWQRHGVAVFPEQGPTGPQLVIDLRLPDDDAYDGYLQRFLG